MTGTVREQRFDLLQHIDGQRIGARHWLVLAVCSLILFLDSFDMFLVGRIAPAIAHGLGETPRALTRLFVIQQTGLAVGAFLIPPLADRFGRKPMLFLGSLVFALTSLASTKVTTLDQLAWLRGLGGIAMSAMLPVGLAMLSEATPRRRRATFIGLALVGFSAGSAASGAVAAWLLDKYGWQVGFLIGGVAPLVCAPLVLLLPESLQFRCIRNPRDRRIAAALSRLDPNLDLPEGVLFHLGEARPVAKGGPLAMFNSEWRLMTIMLWAACFLAMGNIALLANWLPTYFQELAGVPIQKFAILSMIAFVGGAFGTMLAGWLLDRMNPPLLITLYFLTNAVALVLMGVIPFSHPMFLAALTLWNVAQVGGQTAINAYVTLSYPVEMKTSAFGWAGGAGRIGGIVLPGIGGMALSWGQPISVIMTLTALPSLVVALIVAALGLLQRRGRTGRGAELSAVA